MVEREQRAVTEKPAAITKGTQRRDHPLENGGTKSFKGKETGRQQSALGAIGVAEYSARDPSKETFDPEPAAGGFGEKQGENRQPHLGKTWELRSVE